MEITSTQNPRIKSVLQLTAKASIRRERSLFVLEGIRELQRALSHSYQVVEIYHCKDILPEEEWNNTGLAELDADYYSISRNVYSRIAYRDNTGGVIAVLKQKKSSLEQLEVKGNAFYIILESVEKPGNLGAVLRTADAAGVDAVIICDAQTDIYNPNVVRSSTGALFSVPSIISDSAAVISFLKEKGLKIYAATLEGAIPYTSIDFRPACAIAMGTESEGLSELWTQASDANVIIPMKGIADSLNVSTSAAILTFEAMRQRGN